MNAKRQASGSAPTLLLTIDQAAEALGIGATKCRELIADGKLAFVELASAKRIAVSELERYIAEYQQVTPPKRGRRRAS